MKMKKFQFLCKITKNNLKRNKIHTFLTILSTIFCITLIFSLGNYFYSSIYNSYYSTLYSSGKWLYMYTHLSGNLGEQLAKLAPVENTTIKSTVASKQLSEDYEIELVNYSNFDLCPGYLYQGRYPQNENEVIVSREFIARTNYQINDTINLSLHDIEDNQEKNYTFQITGISQFSGYRKENRSMADYIIRLSSQRTSQYVVYVAPKQMSKNTLDSINKQLGNDLTGAGMNDSVMWNQYIGEPSYNIKIYDITLVFLMIFLIGVMSITIHNQFVVSFKQRKHYYGLMSSMGATKSDMRILAVFEATFYTIVGLVLGLLVGYFATKAIYDMTIDIYLKDNFSSFPSPFLISVPLCLIISLLVICTIYVSSLLALRRTYKESIIDLIKSTMTIKNKNSDFSTILFHKKPIWLLLGFRYPLFDKRKYISVIATLIFTVSFFNISTYYFSVNDQYQKQLDDSDNIKILLKHIDLNNPEYRIEDVIDTLNTYNSENENYLFMNGISMGRLREISFDTMITDKYKESFGTLSEENINITFIGVDEENFKDVTNMDQPLLINKKVKIHGIRDEEIVPIFKEDMLKLQFVNSYIVNDSFHYETTDMDIVVDNELSLEDFHIKGLSDTLLKDDYITACIIIAPYQYLIDMNAHYQHMENNDIYFEYVMHTKQHDKLIDEIRHSKVMEYILDIDNPLQQQNKSFSDYLVEILTLLVFIVCIANLGVVITSNNVERKRDFALFQSLGMNLNEIKKLIYIENICLILIAILISIPIILISEGILYYFKFTILTHFTPTYHIFLMMCLGLVFVCILASEIIFRKMKKSSIILALKENTFY